MGLMEQAQRDIKQITTNKREWALDILFTAPDSTTATIQGICTKNHLKFDDLGAPISTKQNRVSISIQALVDAGYPVYNANGDVQLIKHLVTWTDVGGIVNRGKVITNVPGETVGSVVLWLTDYKA